MHALARSGVPMSALLSYMIGASLRASSLLFLK
jgi:hypothetical protein